VPVRMSGAFGELVRCAEFVFKIEPYVKYGIYTAEHMEIFGSKLDLPPSTLLPRST
jgi:hypothetical protein